MPPGATITISTNNSFASSVSSITFSNTQVLTLGIAVTNVPKGRYSLTLTATTNAIEAGSTTINFYAANLWNPTSGTNWANGANWSTGSSPTAGDIAFYHDQGFVNNTSSNYIDASATIDGFINLRNLANTTNTTYFAPNTTLSVVGSNGLAIGFDGISGANKLLQEYFIGDSATLIVSNAAANFAVAAANTGNGPGNNGNFGTLTVNMTNLANLKADVSRFGVGDYTLAGQGAVAAQNVVVYLARTNVIKASYSSDLSVTNGLNFALSAFNNGDPFNNGGQQGFYFGLSNAVFADSIAFGQSRAGSGNNTVRFNNTFTNGNACYAMFRGTNGGRVSLLAAGVDSGNSAPGSNARATMNFSGGTLDMQVDTMWLGRSRNSVPLTNNNALAQGALIFGPGTVNVNTARLGFQPYTNNSWAQGTITVNANGLLSVNNQIELGYVTGDYGSGALAAQTFGQLTVNSGGAIRANEIIARPGSTNNTITINANGNVLVTNTIGDSTTALARITMNAGSLTLPVTAGATNVFVTNLVTAAGSKINILSVSGFSSYPATNVLISYQLAGDHSGLGIGSLPAGFNNMQIVDDTDTKTIQLRISTNAPATLRWRGGENSNWDHTSLNWQNTSTLAITRFFDGDNVIFDDTTGVPTSITVTEAVFPGQSGTGITVSNSVNNFTLVDGGGSIGGTALTKTGTGALTNHCNTLIAAQISQGLFAGQGSVGSVSVASGANLVYSGTIGGTLTTAGQASLIASAAVNGAVTIQSGGSLTNAATIQGGGLTVETNAFLYNTLSGNLQNIGNATVSSNSTFINEGNIGAANQVNTLTILGTFKDSGTGTIYLTTLSLEGGSTFLPGGDGVGTTSILSTGAGSNPGLVRLLAGSTTLIKVDFANPQTNTIVKAQRHVFGPSISFKAFNGCTILVTNINPGAGSFAAGQTLRFFRNSDTDITSGNIGDAGLNTTNSYPVIDPAIPVFGSIWDMSNLRIADNAGFNGLIRVKGVATTPTTLASSFQQVTTVSTNIPPVTNVFMVTTLSWPTEYTGWKLQTQESPLAVGITTNWVSVFDSVFTNSITVSNQFTTNCVFFRLTYP